MLIKTVEEQNHGYVNAKVWFGGLSVQAESWGKWFWFSVFRGFIADTWECECVFCGGEWLWLINSPSFYLASKLVPVPRSSLCLLSSDTVLNKAPPVSQCTEAWVGKEERSVDKVRTSSGTRLKVLQFNSKPIEIHL